MSNAGFNEVSRWEPMLPDRVEEVPKETLIAMCDRVAYRCIEAVNRVSDGALEELAVKQPVKLMTAAGIAVDKAEVLRKQPDRDVGIADPEAFQRNIETIAKVLAERGALDAILEHGINIQIGGQKAEPAEPKVVEPAVVPLEPAAEPPPERKPEDFGEWIG